jgi:hypothetical protein
MLITTQCTPRETWCQNLLQLGRKHDDGKREHWCLLEQWYRMTELFETKGLYCPEDRLAAFISLAQQVFTRPGTPYVLGLGVDLALFDIWAHFAGSQDPSHDILLLAGLAPTRHDTTVRMAATRRPGMFIGRRRLGVCTFSSPLERQDVG